MVGAAVARIHRTGAARPRSWGRAGPAAALALLLAGPLCLASCAEFVLSAATTTGLAMAEERTVGDAVKDLTIQAELNHLFFQDDLELYQDVSFSVIEGRVLLKGTVPTQEDRVRASWLARKATRVSEVINEMEVLDEGDVVDYVRDTWISARLRTRLLVDFDVLSLNYSIETVNGTVYLMGIAQDEAELSQVTQHARNVDGVKDVVSHVVLKDDPRRPAPRQ